MALPCPLEYLDMSLIKTQLQPIIMSKFIDVKFV